MPRILEIARTHYSKLLKQAHESGIESISEENWSTLKATAELILKPEFAVFQVSQKIDKLKQQLPDNSSEFNAAPYREIIHWARLIQPNYRKRQAKQIEHLNDPLWWHRCVERIKTLPRAEQEYPMEVLNELLNRWHFHQAYAHYSTLDMIHVYQTTLPVFSEWLHYAKTELKQKEETLSPRIKTFYQNYLTWFENALLKEKALLRNCLRERLAIGMQKGYGAWDDVIESMRDELKRIGLLQNTPKENTWICGYLTPEMFVSINQMIEQDGSEAEKIALYQLTGDYPHAFDKSPAFYHHYRTDAQGCRYLIPPARSDMIPTDQPLYLQLPRFLRQLFWGDMVTYTFFQEPHCQFLLAQNKAGLAAPTDLSLIILDELLEHHPAWKQSDLCLQLCQSEFERTAKWLKSVLLFFFPAVKSLLQGYQDDLKADAESWATKQLMMLKEVIERTDDQPLNLQQQEILNTAFHHLEQLQQQWEFSSDFLETLASINPDHPDQLSQTQLILQPTVITTECLPLLPAREAFPLALQQVVRLSSKTGSLLDEQQSLFETQFQTDAVTYDSVALRGWVEDHLANTPDLPRSLVAGLQAVLDEPQFSEAALDRAENQALHTWHKTMMEKIVSETTQLTPIEDTTALWDEDPWDDTEEAFEAHCQALKRYVAHLPQGLSVSENEKLCQYTLQCLKHIDDLTSWDSFILKRDRIKQLLNLLLEMSGSTFALHHTLHAVGDMFSTVTAQSWRLVKDILLMTEIQTLEHFINRSSVNLFQQEAISYGSQAELPFSRRRRLSQDADSAPILTSAVTTFQLR